MSDTPIFTQEQLLFLATHLFDKQDKMFSYNLKPTKRKALLASLFNASNFDALIQRSQSQAPVAKQPDDIYYQWMMSAGEEGDQTYKPFQPDFYDAPLHDQFSTVDDAALIIENKDEYMLDAKDLAKATLMKISCQQVDNPFAHEKPEVESLDPIECINAFNLATQAISQMDSSCVEESVKPIMKSTNTMIAGNPVNVKELKAWIEAEGHLDMFDADKATLYLGSDDNLWMIATHNINQTEKLEVRFRYFYVDGKLASKSNIQKMNQDDRPVGWSLDVIPDRGEDYFFSSFEPQDSRHNTHLTPSDLDIGYELMMQMYNRVNKQVQ